MASEGEILELILGAAEADENIRAIILSDAPKMSDIRFYVLDAALYWDNLALLSDIFSPLHPLEVSGEDKDGVFMYQIDFDNGSVDVSFDSKPWLDDGYAARILLDKDGGSGLVPDSLL
jgi:hypothetical protein